MGRPYSQDLRERVVAAVEQGGLSRRKAAAQFAVGISTVINWVRRFRATSKVDYKTMWNFVHAEKLSFKKNRARQRARSPRRRAQA
jgi:transposase